MRQKNDDLAHSSHNTGDFDQARYIEMYELFRKYCNHEDGLVNNRNSWFIGLNSFLFTSIALSFFVFGEKYYSNSGILVFLFAILISIVGAISSFSSFFSIKSAFSAIFSINDLWVKFYEDKYSEHTEKLGIYLPGMMGGAWPNRRECKANAMSGRWSSYVLTLTTTLCWLTIGFFSVFGYLDQCSVQSRDDSEKGAVERMCIVTSVISIPTENSAIKRD